jgi:ubiquinol-cytochrome c reductase cytochrome c1 subunit
MAFPAAIAAFIARLGIIRFVALLVGLAFSSILLLSMIVGLATYFQNPPEELAAEKLHLHPKHLALSSDGPFGKYDKKQLQRGFQVYSEVCAACHGLSLVAFHDLQGLGYNEAEIKKIAKDWPAKQPAFDAKGGTWGERDNLPSDHFPKVYYPGTGTPPDLSLMAKARHEGPAYVYSLLTGYEAQKPEDVARFPGAKTPEGMFYNPYFANLNIAMPEPLTDSVQAEYTDGTRETKDQKAKDIAAFLVWAAEPTMETRHETGLAVVIFLLLTTLLAFGAYRSVWRGVKH